MGALACACGCFASKSTCGKCGCFRCTLTSGVHRTPGLSSIKQSEFKEKVSQKLRHHFLFELIDWC